MKRAGRFTNWPSSHQVALQPRRAYGIGTVKQTSALYFSYSNLVVDQTYSCHTEVTEDTASLTTSNTSVLDLGWTSVAVHLRQLQLGLGAGALWQKCVADNVAECLSDSQSNQYIVL
jgi:hypothetical protein